MPRQQGFAVDTAGLKDLRRDLRKTDREALKEIQKVIKGAAKIVAEEAGRLAPRGTRAIPDSRRPRKRLADAYAGSTSGDKGIVRNPLPYAPIVEFRQSGTPAQMRGVRPVQRAIENKQDDIVDALGDGIENVARRNGWR